MAPESFGLSRLEREYLQQGGGRRRWVYDRRSVPIESPENIMFLVSKTWNLGIYVPVFLTDSFLGPLTGLMTSEVSCRGGRTEIDGQLGLA